MYAKNIATAAQAFLDKEASPQKAKQLKGCTRPCITPAKIRQLRRLFRYQLAAIDGKMRGKF